MDTIWLSRLPAHSYPFLGQMGGRALASGQEVLFIGPGAIYLLYNAPHWRTREGDRLSTNISGNTTLASMLPMKKHTSTCRTSSQLSSPSPSSWRSTSNPAGSCTPCQDPGIVLSSNGIVETQSRSWCASQRLHPIYSVIAMVHVRNTYRCVELREVSLRRVPQARTSQYATAATTLLSTMSGTHVKRSSGTSGEREVGPQGSPELHASSRYMQARKPGQKMTVWCNIISTLATIAVVIYLLHNGSVQLTTAVSHMICCQTANSHWPFCS